MTSLVHLELQNNMLTGSLPKDLTALQGLQVLNIAGNRIYGNLPDEWGNFKSLSQLKLGGNLLNGTVPSSWSSLSSLQYLDISDNRIVGDLSDIPIKSMERLQFFNMSSNHIRGFIDVAIWPHSLRQIYLSRNALSGGLDWVAQIPSSVTWIDVSVNDFVSDGDVLAKGLLQWSQTNSLRQSSASLVLNLQGVSFECPLYDSLRQDKRIIIYIDRCHPAPKQFIFAAISMLFLFWSISLGACGFIACCGLEAIGQAVTGLTLSLTRWIDGISRLTVRWSCCRGYAVVFILQLVGGAWTLGWYVFNYHKMIQNATAPSLNRCTAMNQRSTFYGEYLMSSTVDSLVAFDDQATSPAFDISFIFRYPDLICPTDPDPLGFDSCFDPIPSNFTTWPEYYHLVVDGWPGATSADIVAQNIDSFRVMCEQSVLERRVCPDGGSSTIAECAYDSTKQECSRVHDVVMETNLLYAAVITVSACVVACKELVKVLIVFGLSFMRFKPSVVGHADEVVTDVQRKPLTIVCAAGAKQRDAVSTVTYACAPDDAGTPSLVSAVPIEDVTVVSDTAIDVNDVTCHATATEEVAAKGNQGLGESSDIVLGLMTFVQTSPFMVVMMAVDPARAEIVSSLSFTSHFSTILSLVFETLLDNANQFAVSVMYSLTVSQQGVDLIFVVNIAYHLVQLSYAVHRAYPAVVLSSIDPPPRAPSQRKFPESQRSQEIARGRSLDKTVTCGAMSTASV